MQLTHDLSTVCVRLRYMDKRLSIQLNGKRNITGVLRGFDQFMNLVLEDTSEVSASSGAVASSGHRGLGTTVVRGNSVLLIDCIDKL